MMRNCRAAALVMLVMASACGSADDDSPGIERDAAAGLPQRASDAAQDTGSTVDHATHGAAEQPALSDHDDNDAVGGPAAAGDNAHDASTGPAAAGHAAHAAGAAAQTRAEPTGDHAAHAAGAPSPRGRAAQPVDHAAHVGAAPRPASQPSVSSPTHAAHEASPAAESGLPGLLTLLLADERVQARIAADPELARSWADPAVRSQITEAAKAAEGMALLRELVRGLLTDPGVMARIEADSVLRNLWSDEDVREWLRRPAR